MIEKLLDPIKLAFGLRLKQILSEAKIEPSTYKAHRYQYARSARDETLRTVAEYVLFKLPQANDLRKEYKIKLVQGLTAATISLGESMYADPLRSAIIDFAAANELPQPNFDSPILPPG